MAPTVKSLRAWLDADATRTQAQLLKALREQDRIDITSGHLSAIISGHWGASLKLALALSRITGVPVGLIVTPKPTRTA